jgi:hypothetical protein
MNVLDALEEAMQFPLMNAGRRFPPPWTVEDLGSCFVVKDNNGQKLSYVYYEEEPGRRSTAKMFSRDEARGIAANFAKLPELERKKALASRPGTQTNRLGMKDARPFLSHCGSLEPRGKADST